MKTCPRCSLSLPLERFGKNARMRDGLQIHCRDCRREQQREYRARHPEKARELGKEAMRRRRENEPERVRDYQRQWRTQNPEKVAAAKKAWEAENYERLRAFAREANRRWKRAHPEYVREQWLRRRALKVNATVGDVDLDALWVEQSGKCGICDEAIDRSLAWPDPLSASVDHIVPLAKGGAHAQENLQWACLVCNLRKGARLLDAA